MTARFARANHGTGHSYTLDGARVPGVTTVLGILDKPALVNWAAEQSATFAVENWDRLGSLDIIARHKEIVRARFSANRKAVAKGNRIHDLGEALANGKTVDVPAEIQPQVEAYARFLDAWELETIAAETPVCNTSYGYAGTFDLLAHSPKLGTVLCDIKTGKNIYSEVALQLGAYRACDLRLEQREGKPGPRGGKPKKTWAELPMIAVDHCMAFHVRDDSVDMRPVVTTPSVESAFLYLLEVYVSWHQRVDFSARDEPNYSPVIGDAIWPETPDLESILSDLEEEPSDD